MTANMFDALPKCVEPKAQWTIGEITYAGVEILRMLGIAGPRVVEYGQFDGVGIYSSQDLT